jgi:mannose-6-phosphate isomerase-like protein (cupin superfamily)
MRNAIAVLAVVAGLTFAAQGQAASKKGGHSLLIPADQLKWSDVPGMAGVQISPVQGDPNKGAAHFFLKFTGGFAAPLHHHTADHYAAVVAGTLVLTVDGKEVQLPAGSFFTFTGKMEHTTSCQAGADCILFMDARQKWDVVPEKVAAAK